MEVFQFLFETVFILPSFMQIVSLGIEIYGWWLLSFRICLVKEWHGLGTDGSLIEENTSGVLMGL